MTLRAAARIGRRAMAVASPTQPVCSLADAAGCPVSTSPKQENPSLRLHSVTQEPPLPPLWRQLRGGHAPPCSFLHHVLKPGGEAGEDWASAARHGPMRARGAAQLQKAVQWIVNYERGRFCLPRHNDGSAR
eukprot:357218-Chlamydomonas_euryale.AAC.23